MKHLCWLLLFCGACEEFATPAQLATPTPIALTMTPAYVEPGEEATLELVVTSATLGQQTNLDVDWSVASAIPGDPLLGEIEGNGVTATYTAPMASELSQLPTSGAIEAFTVVGEKEIHVAKATIIGQDLPVANPTFTKITASGLDVTSELSITAVPDEVITLEVETDRDNPRMTYAWYSTIGEIARYQSNPTTLIAPNNPFVGDIFVVVRDGSGGQAWQKIDFIIE